MLPIRNFIALLVFSLLAFGITSASAVNMGITSSSVIQTTHGKACTQTTLNATNNKTNHIVISNIPPSCRQLNTIVKIIAVDEATSILSTNTFSSSTVTLPNPVINPATIDKVKVIISGWEVKTQWVYVPAVVTIDRSTPAVTIQSTFSQTLPTSFCVNVTISTTSLTPIPWVANLYYLNLPLNSDNIAAHYSFTSGFGFVSSDFSNNRLQFKGLTTATEMVSSGAPQNLQICNSSTPYPPRVISPEIVYSQIVGNPSTLGKRKCKAVIAQVTGAPFYVGWEAIVDVSNLMTGHVGPSFLMPPTASLYTTTLVSGNIYKVVGIAPTTQGIRTGETEGFNMCWGVL